MYYKNLFIFLALAVCTTASSAQAQLLDGLLKRAERAVENEIEAKIDRVTRCMTGDERCIATARSNGGTVEIISSNPGTARLLAHFPLDGNIAVSGAGASEAKIYTKYAGRGPTAITGKIGQALHFGSPAAIAMPFNLDPSAYPQITITAWVKRDSSSRGLQTVVSSGAGHGPALMVEPPIGARVRAGRTSVKLAHPLPADEWTFVAGVADIGASTARVHLSDASVVREINTSTLYKPTAYPDPQDEGGERREYIFIGALSFDKNWQAPAQGLAIDDVRIFAGVLSSEELQAVANNADVPNGAWNGTASASAPETSGDGGPNAAIDAIGGSTRTVRVGHNSPAAGIRDMTPEPREPEETTVGNQESGWHFSPTDTKLTGVSGRSGQIRVPLDFSSQAALQQIFMRQRARVPCEIAVGSSIGQVLEDRCAEAATGSINPIFWVDLSPAAVTALSVCVNGRKNGRVKGVELRGEEISREGDLINARQDARSFLNCAEWRPLVLCPTGYVSTGVVAHFDDPRTPALVGLQLKCSRIVKY